MCGVSLNRYSVTVGQQPVGQVNGYARQFAEAINALVTSLGGDLSGRWLAKNAGRSAAYWAKRQKMTHPYNVGDTEDLAKALKMTTHLVENLAGDPDLLRSYLEFGVAGLPEDLLRRGFDLAASGEKTQTATEEDDLNP